MLGKTIVIVSPGRSSCRLPVTVWPATVNDVNAPVMRTSAAKP